jgi:hypothetical protein
VKAAERSMHGYNPGSLDAEKAILKIHKFSIYAFENCNQPSDAEMRALLFFVFEHERVSNCFHEKCMTELSE